MACMTKRIDKTLYDPAFERDSCGFGLIANIDDLPSHWVVQTAIAALARLTHRGAVAADGKTGDGCGLLLKSPKGFLRAVGEECGFKLGERFAAGTVFLSQDDKVAAAARKVIDTAIAEIGLEVAGWRQVPVDRTACGDKALATLPKIEQVFVNAPNDMPRGRFNRRLFLARRRAENRIEDSETYIASLSSVTLSYKGMIMPSALPQFLSGSSRSTTRVVGSRFPSAFLDQHLTGVATRSAVPLSGAQRRDQHDPGQPQLGDGACQELPLRQT